MNGVSPDLSIVRAAVDAIWERLRQQPPSPQLREWRTRAAKYEHAVTLWATSTPNVSQVLAMHACIRSLTAEVFGHAAVATPVAARRARVAHSGRRDDVQLALAQWAAER